MEAIKSLLEDSREIEIIVHRVRHEEEDAFDAYCILGDKDNPRHIEKITTYKDPDTQECYFLLYKKGEIWRRVPAKSWEINYTTSIEKN